MSEYLPSFVTAESVDELLRPLTDEDYVMPPPTRNALATRRYRAKLLRRLQAWRAGPCEMCGASTSARTLAHLHPTSLRGRSRGVERRYADLIRHPACFARMCWDCHRPFDREHTTADRVALPFADPMPLWALVA